MNHHSRLGELYRSALPSVRKEPLSQLPQSLYAYVRRISSRQQIRLSALTVLVFPLTLVPLELQRRMVDNAIKDADLRLLLALGSLYLLVLLIHGALKWLRNIYMERTAEGVARVIRRRIVQKGAVGAETQEGTEQSIISAEAEKLGGFVAESIAFPLLQVGIIVSVAAYMLFVQPVVAAVALAFLLPSVIVTSLIQPILNRLSEEKIKTARDLGDRVLAIGGGAAPEDTDAYPLTDRIYGLRLRFGYFKHAMKALNNFFTALGPLSVLVVGGWLAIRGETQVGTIVAFISGYQRMTDPVRELIKFYRQMSVMRVQYALVYQATQATEQV